MDGGQATCSGGYLVQRRGEALPEYGSDGPMRGFPSGGTVVGVLNVGTMLRSGGAVLIWQLCAPDLAVPVFRAGARRR